jgi:hypothetical protein
LATVLFDATHMLKFKRRDPHSSLVSSLGEDMVAYQTQATPTMKVFGGLYGLP